MSLRAGGGSRTRNITHQSSSSAEPLRHEAHVQASLTDLTGPDSTLAWTHLGFKGLGFTP